MLDATWFGACQRCDCGRTVTIERGGAEYLLTGTDPDFEVVEIVDLTELAERIRDATDGARHNPELLAELVRMEDESGFAFRQDLRLGSITLVDEVAEVEEQQECQLCLW